MIVISEQELSLLMTMNMMNGVIQACAADFSVKQDADAIASELNAYYFKTEDADDAANKLS